MPQGGKSSTDRQRRRAEHIGQGCEKRGTPKEEAECSAWATANTETGGGEKSGSGRGKAENRTASRRGGKRTDPALPSSARLHSAGQLAGHAVRG